MDKKFVELPNGFTLYWKDNEEGRRTYYSDELGLDATIVWDTSLIDSSTLLAAIVQEEKLTQNESKD